PFTSFSRATPSLVPCAGATVVANTAAIAAARCRVFRIIVIAPMVFRLSAAAQHQVVEPRRTGEEDDAFGVEADGFELQQLTRAIGRDRDFEREPAPFARADEALRGGERRL